MPEAIIDGRGSGNLLGITAENRALTEVSGTVNINNISGSITIGSVSAHVDSIYVQSGTSYISSGDNINISTMPKTEVYTSGDVNIGNLYAGSHVWQGTSPWSVIGSMRVVQDSTVRQIDTGSIRILNFSDLGSHRIITEVPPTDSSKNNPAWKFEYATSGTATGITGSRIGSIIQFIGAGSFVNVITYSNNRLNTIGSFT